MTVVESTNAEDDVTVETVRQLLPSTNLLAINYFEASMSRTGEEPVAAGLQFPAKIEIGYQVVNETIVYRFAVSVERPDLSARVVVGVQYAVSGIEPFADPDIARVFGQRVALPAAYPYARSKMFDLTVDTGLSPVTLNMIDVSRANLSGTPENDAVGREGEAPSWNAKQATGGPIDEHNQSATPVDATGE